VLRYSPKLSLFLARYVSLRVCLCNSFRFHNIINKNLCPRSSTLQTMSSASESSDSSEDSLYNSDSDEDYVFESDIDDSDSDESDMEQNESDVDSQTYLFPQFKEFPRDTRFMIYDLLLPGPRVVHIYFNEIKTGTVDRVWDNQDVEQEGNFFDPYSLREKYKMYRADIGRDYGPQPFHSVRTSSLPIHEIFSAFREAYEFFRDLYCQTFATNGVKASVWFSSTLDTVYLDAEICYWYSEMAESNWLHMAVDFSAVKKLALAPDGVDWSRSFSSKDMISTVVSWFENLEHLTLVADFEWRGSYLLLSGLVLVEDEYTTALYEKYSPKVDARVRIGMLSWLCRMNEKLAKRLPEALLKRIDRKTLSVDEKILTSAFVYQRYQNMRRLYHEAKSQYQCRASPAQSIEHGRSRANLCGYSYDS
jgi:hypothetical protein